ncbi:amine oxidase [Periconia macrospinosa]|uniref:Amine oxidase n=1 Tax=Periconia macrospinosa TaxID=97972 RepID=A0A2V1D8X5_9PLEO|nr:amine oxidase [Periconia macrospinosa]
MSAYTLHRAGLHTVVLEAKTLIGGRSRSQQLKSGPGVIELGATWINNITQPDVYALTQTFGLETQPQYTDGDVVFQMFDQSVRRVMQTNATWSSDPALAELEQMMNLLVFDAANKTDIRNFNAFPEKQDVTFAEWLDQNGLWEFELVKGLASSLSGALVGREPEEIGVHYFFDYIKSGGGLADLGSEGKYGAQSLKVKNGTTAIATGLADALPEGTVLVNTPVVKIAQNKGTSYITTSCGKTFKSRKVILAIPTNTYHAIEFSPPLSANKQTLVSNTKPGVYAKMILSYTEPWWRNAGLVGKFSSMTGPVCFSWDTSDVSSEQYSLAIFIAGDIGRKWGKLPEREKETAVIQHLATLVGKELAGKARDVLEVNYVEWTVEEYLGGAPTSAMGPGYLRRYGAVLREPFGDLHFGGGETAFEWKGYLEGAVRAGRRAAEEVIEGWGNED